MTDWKITKKNFTDTDPYKIKKLASLLGKMYPDKSINITMPIGHKHIEIRIEGVKQ